MNCPKTQKHLMEYIDGELKAELNEVLARHLTSCPACRRSEENLRREVIDPLRTARKHEPSEEIWHRIRARVENHPPSPFAVLEHWWSLVSLKRTAFALGTFLIIVSGLFFHFSDVAQKTSGPEDLNAYVLNQMKIFNELSTPSEGESPYNFETAIEHVFIKAKADESLIEMKYMIPDNNLGTSLEHYFM